MDRDRGKGGVVALVWDDLKTRTHNVTDAEHSNPDPDNIMHSNLNHRVARKAHVDVSRLLVLSNSTVQIPKTFKLQLYKSFGIFPL